MRSAMEAEDLACLWLPAFPGRNNAGTPFSGCESGGRGCCLDNRNQYTQEVKYFILTPHSRDTSHTVGISPPLPGGVALPIQNGELVLVLYYS